MSRQTEFKELLSTLLSGCHELKDGLDPYR